MEKAPGSFIESQNSFGWKKTFQIVKSIHSLILPCLGLNRGPQCLISASLKDLWGWGFSHLCGEPVPVSENPFSQKVFLLSNVNFSCCNVRPFPLVLSFVPREKNPIPACLQPPIRELYRAKRYTLSLLLSRLNKISSLSFRGRFWKAPL